MWRCEVHLVEYLSMSHQVIETSINIIFIIIIIETKLTHIIILTYIY